MPERHVLVVGDVNTDMIVPYPTRQSDGTLRFSNPSVIGGGSAANTAHALARLGHGVEFIGTVGADAAGRQCRNEFTRAGIGCGGLITDAELNTVCVYAFVTPEGERLLWPYPEDHQSFRELDARRVDWSLLDGACWVHSSGMVYSSASSAPDTVTALLAAAHARGVPVSFDLNLRVENYGLPDDYRRRILAACEHAAYLFGSEREEFAHLVPDSASPATALVRPGRAVVTRDGRTGSTAYVSDEAGRIGVSHAPAYDVPAADTIGAGDVYNAGFIHALLTEATINTALATGNAVAGYKVSRTGARATPTVSELAAFMATTPVVN
ncbi:MAG: carbohydrate kinase family protein [Propionibacteriaceae bacterium]|jgi:sugar/nucleoside kinase (ribokinase family)|nr:carbohydrate kinase family protein [Propionibacteriaceae bacterium]